LRHSKDWTSLRLIELKSRVTSGAGLKRDAPPEQSAASESAHCVPAVVNEAVTNGSLNWGRLMHPAPVIVEAWKQPCGAVGKAEGDEVGVWGAEEGGDGGEAQGAELDGACGVGEDAREADVAGATALRREETFNSWGGKRGCREGVAEQGKVDTSIRDSARLEAVVFRETEGYEFIVARQKGRSGGRQ